LLLGVEVHCGINHPLLSFVMDPWIPRLPDAGGPTDNHRTPATLNQRSTSGSATLSSTDFGPQTHLCSLISHRHFLHPAVTRVNDTHAQSEAAVRCRNADTRTCRLHTRGIEQRDRNWRNVDVLSVLHISLTRPWKRIWLAKAFVPRRYASITVFDNGSPFALYASSGRMGICREGF
jgi:hypothetical protein